MPERAMRMKPLTENMKNELQRLYQREIDHNPFYPKEAHGMNIRYGGVANGLQKRGLCVKKEGIWGYVITRKGIEVAEELGLSIRWTSQMNSEYFAGLAQAKVAFAAHIENDNNFNANYCASVWQKKSLRLNIASTKEWERGGIIIDNQKHHDAKVYRYMSLLAIEKALN